MYLLVRLSQSSMGVISTKFTDDLLQAKQQNETVRQTMTADIARTSNTLITVCNIYLS